MNVEKPIRYITSTQDKETLLEELKDEIIRLGLENDPSKTRYNELYDRNNSASPTKLLSDFDCTWGELMDKIGLHYDGDESFAKKMSAFNKGKKYAQTWSGMTRQEVVDVVVEEMRRTHSWSAGEYLDKRDKKNTPSLPIINKIIGNWKTVKAEYVQKYGEME